MSFEDTAKGNWLEVKGTIKQKWGKLTDNDITEINGSRDVLIGKLVKLYGIQKDQAKNDVDQFWNQGTK